MLATEVRYCTAVAGPVGSPIRRIRVVEPCWLQRPAGACLRRSIEEGAHKIIARNLRKKVRDLKMKRETERE